MCGRYWLEQEQEEQPRLHLIMEELTKEHPPMAEFVHRGDIFPSEIAPVIVEDQDGYKVRPLKWGFPRAGGGGLVINSRSEKAEITPMFSKAARERRCLVPVSGFYEWRRTASGGKTKNQFAFTLAHAQDELLYLAGFYGPFLGGFENGGFDGFAILTREADEQMEPYHNRMPVILRDEELKKAWLATGAVPYEELRRHFTPPKLAVRAMEKDGKKRAGDQVDA